MTSFQKAHEKVTGWRKNPAQFVIDNFKVEPDRWQKEALEALGDPAKTRIAMKSCVGPGKSALLAWTGWWFLCCFAERGEHPNGVAVSVTADNLKDNLWKEFSKWQGRSPFLLREFTWTKERIFYNKFPATWWLSARSFSKSADTEEQGRTLSGLHSKFVLALIDESGDINPAILRAAEQALSNCKWGKIVQAGNPTSMDGVLYLATVKQRALWEVINITGDPDDARRSNRIDITWAKEQIAEYGRDNPWVMASILGIFPPGGINTLLPLDVVEAAMHRHLREDQYAFSQKRLGIDAARFGDDPWVIFPRQGLAAFKPVIMRNPRSNDVAARVALGKQRWGSEMEFFDGTGGYASGAIDSMIQAGYSPQEINFSGKANDPRYFNKRSEMWFLMAEWIKRGGALPLRPGLLAELTVPTFTFDKGKFRLEEKEQIKSAKRLGRSPSEADALALTFAMPEMPGGNMPKWMQQATQGGSAAKSEYDPFDQTRMEEALVG